MENQGGQSPHPAKPVLWAGIKPAASRAEKPGYRAAGQGEIFQGKKHAWGRAGFPLFPLNRLCQGQVLSGLFPGQPRKKVSFLVPFYEILPVTGIFQIATSGMCSGELSVVDDTHSKAEATAKTGRRVKSKNCSGDSSGLLVHQAAA